VLSAPEAEKWRRRNGAAIERVLPRLADAQRLLGYPTGDQPVGVPATVSRGG
jgi:hypothetical protein